MSNLSRKEQAEASREVIIESSIRLIAKNGLEKTSFQMIADDCGLHQTTLVYYYKNKRNLYRECIMVILRQSDAAIHAEQVAGLSGIQRLEAYVRRNIKWAKTSPAEAQMILLLYYFGSNDPEFQGLYRLVKDQVQGKLEAYLNQAIDEGQLSSKQQDVHKTADLIHSQLVGLLVNGLATGRIQSSSEKRLFADWMAVFRALTGL